MRLDEMYYTEIEMEGMKEILRDKEEEIKKLEKELRSLKSELEIRKATAKDYARLQGVELDDDLSI